MAAALPASRKPSSEWISTGPCSKSSSSGTSSTMCTYLAGSVIGSLSLVELVESLNVATVLTMPDDVSDLVRLVQARIAEAADPDRAPGMQAYMKSAMPYRGVTSVPLRAVCRAVYDEHPLPDRRTWESCVRE